MVWDDTTERGSDNGQSPNFVASAGMIFGGRFRVEDILGNGATGRVYRAMDLSQNTRVAIKVLHKRRAGDRKLVERFKREAAILAKVMHPSIVKLIAFDEDQDERPWIAMELLQGETLGDRIKLGPLDPRDVHTILVTLTEALDAAHRVGVVHRDLKPENIFLPSSQDPIVKVLDFGLARLANANAITDQGSILGTPRYMAPELVRAAEKADSRADIFAVGAVLFELLTAKSMYEANDLGQLFGKVLSADRLKLRHLRPELPDGLQEVVDKACALDAEQRYATAGNVADALGRALGISKKSKTLTFSTLEFRPGVGAAVHAADPAQHVQNEVGHARGLQSATGAIPLLDIQQNADTSRFSSSAAVPHSVGPTFSTPRPRASQAPLRDENSERPIRNARESTWPGLGEKDLGEREREAAHRAQWPQEPRMHGRSHRPAPPNAQSSASLPGSLSVPGSLSGSLSKVGMGSTIGLGTPSRPRSKKSVLRTVAVVSLLVVLGVSLGYLLNVMSRSL